MRRHYKIEAWNQPNGRGGGWAPCSDRKAELFFVFENDSRIAEFNTREGAEIWVEQLQAGEHMKPAPLCRYCGKEIGKETRTVYLRAKSDVPVQSTRLSRYLVIEDDSKWPLNRADCQRLTDWKVVSISRDSNMERVWSFNEWDGESYVDNYFCKGEHAKQFGYLAASEGRATVNYNRGLAEQMRKTA